MSDDRTYCNVCRLPIAREPWLLLNRYVVGTGIAVGTGSVLANGEYFWEPEDNNCSGHILHVKCVLLWIDMKMAEVDLKVQVPDE